MFRTNDIIKAMEYLQDSIYTKDEIIWEMEIWGDYEKVVKKFKLTQKRISNDRSEFFLFVKNSEYEEIYRTMDFISLNIALTDYIMGDGYGSGCKY